MTAVGQRGWPSSYAMAHKKDQKSKGTVQYSTVQYSTVQYSTLQNNTTPHNATEHNTIQYSTVQYSTVQYNTAQYSTVPCKTTQNNTTQRNTTQRNTTQHNTTQHNTTEHNTPIEKNKEHRYHYAPHQKIVPHTNVVCNKKAIDEQRNQNLNPSLWGKIVHSMSLLFMTIAVPRNCACKAMSTEDHEVQLLFNDVYKHATRIKDLTFWNQIVLPKKFYNHTPTCKKFPVFVGFTCTHVSCVATTWPFPGTSGRGRSRGRSRGGRGSGTLIVHPIVMHIVSYFM